MEGKRLRRWAWRGCLAAAVLLTFTTVVGVRAFNRACDGSLEGLRYLTNVRAQLATATAPPPSTPRPTSTLAPAQAQTAPAQPTPEPAPPIPSEPTAARRLLGAVGVAGDAALVTLIRIKQHDAIAYPAHIVAAHTLDVAGCGTDAVRLQWLKAGLHASHDRQIEYVASALVTSAEGPDDLADLRQVVRTWTERAPASLSLRRVLAALDNPRT